MLQALRAIVPALSCFALVSFAAGCGGGSEESGDTAGAALTEAEFAALHSLKEDAAPTPRGIPLTVGASGGRAGFEGYLSLPSGASENVPTVLVIHEWWGLNDHIRHWADRVAAAGYAALAVDLYGGTVATTREEAMRAMGEVDPEEARARLAAALWYARNHPRLGAPRVVALGWCFGGTWSLETARMDPDLDGAVIYYGRLTRDREELASIRARVLGIFGTQDPSIPNADVDRFEADLAALGIEHRILRYPAAHAFANPSGGNYDAPHAEAAWTEVRAFLKQVLGPPVGAD